jgi:hypothetical protein
MTFDYSLSFTSIILIISQTGIIIIKISADRLNKNELIGLIRKD